MNQLTANYFAYYAIRGKPLYKKKGFFFFLILFLLRMRNKRNKRQSPCHIRLTLFPFASYIRHDNANKGLLQRFRLFKLDFAAVGIVVLYPIRVVSVIPLA